eukprot:3939162-Rhodomonas_salina.4
MIQHDDRHGCLMIGERRAGTPIGRYRIAMRCIRDPKAHSRYPAPTSQLERKRMMIAQVRMWPAQQPETCRSSSVGDGRYLQTRNLALHAVHLPTPGLRVSGCVSRA